MDSTGLFSFFPHKSELRTCYQGHISRRFRPRFWVPKSPFCSNFYGPYSSFVSLCMTRSSSKCHLSSKIAIVHMQSMKQTGDTYSNGYLLSSNRGSPTPIHFFYNPDTLTMHLPDMCHQVFKECTCIQRTHPVELFGFSEQLLLQTTFIPDSFHFGNRRNVFEGNTTRGERSCFHFGNNSIHS